MGFPSGLIAPRDYADVKLRDRDMAMPKEKDANWELTAALEVLDRARCELIDRDAPAPIEADVSERRYARAKLLVQRIRRSLARAGSRTREPRQ
jgi:hypothetical protein